MTGKKANITPANKTPESSNPKDAHVAKSSKSFFSPVLQIIDKKERTQLTLKELNDALKNESNLSILSVNDTLLEGSILHHLTQTAKNDDISWRMVYALSNAGIDVNMKNSKGNTALHLAYMRGYTEIGFKFIEALLKVGTDLNIKNNNNKIALNYMEDIEQLNSMYDAHFPGIWTAVENSQPDLVQKLMNAWVKGNSAKKNGISLSQQVSQVDNQKINEIMENFSLSSDYIHALFAMDEEKMNELHEKIGEKFDPNMADFCYCFSWFKPVCRNLPTFLLEIAIDTDNLSIIKNILALKCDVNLLHSLIGDPFYFFAFENKFKSIKTDFLQRANLNVKNHRGQNILHHLVQLYIQNENDTEYKNYLIEEFNSLLKRNPLLLINRDQDDQTLIEEILSMYPNNYKKSLIFLKEISNFVMELLNAKNIKLFQDFIYQSYGLILLNTPIFIETNDPNALSLDNTISLQKYILDNNIKEMKLFLKKFFESDFKSILNEFATAVKIGDLNFIKECFLSEKNLFLLVFRDYSGRSCLHLAVLHGQYSIAKFLLQQDLSLLNVVDNLNRTSLHYAYATKDFKIIELLLFYKINKYVRDSKFLLAEEYVLDDVIRDDWFRIKNFRDTETRKSNAIYCYMRCFEYKKIKAAIIKNDTSELRKINDYLNSFELSFKDLPIINCENTFYEGQIYTPPLELAMENRCFSAFRYILEMTGDCLFTSRNPKSKSNIRTKSAFVVQKSIENYLTYLREKAEEDEMDEIIDILDDFEEDKEIVNCTLNDTFYNQPVNYYQIPKQSLKNLSETIILKNKENKPAKEDYSNLGTKFIKPILRHSNQSQQPKDPAYNSQLSDPQKQSKLCNIL